MKWPHRSTVFVLFTALALPFACDSGSPSDDDDSAGDTGGGDTENGEEGEAGSEQGEEGPAESSEGGSTCSDAGEACEINGDCCGFDDGTAVCIGDVGGCADLCETGDECMSGCCAELEGGGGACAPVEFCG